MRSAPYESFANTHQSGRSIPIASACSVSLPAAILVAVLGAHAPIPSIRQRSAADKLDARPDYTLLIYPGYLNWTTPTTSGRK